MIKDKLIMVRMRRNDKNILLFLIFFQIFIKKFCHQMLHISIVKQFKSIGKNRINLYSTFLLNIFPKSPNSFRIQIVLINSLSILKIDYTGYKSSVIHDIALANLNIWIKIPNLTNKALNTMLYLSIFFTFFLHDNSKGTIKKLAITIPLYISNMKNLSVQSIEILHIIKNRVDICL